MPPIDLAQAQPGDLVLCRGTGLIGGAIRFGQRLRRPARYSRWNHAAILTEQTDGAWWVVEAEGHGVAHNQLGARDCVVVDSEVQQRARVVRFALDQVGARYGFLTIASLVVDLLTPARIDLRREGTWICSALAARAVEHGGRLFDDLNPFQAMPADLAEAFDA